MNHPELTSDIYHEIERRMELIRNTVDEASAALLRIRQEKTGLQIRTKAGYRDLLTRADLESEQIITKSISTHFSGDKILAEEGGSSGGNGDFLWVIDPLDGTVNYAHGIPLYSISVGLVLSGQVVAGVVKLPATGEIFHGIIAKGSYLDSTRLSVSGSSSLRDSIVVTGFPYERDPVLEGLTKTVRSILERSAGFRRTGSAALDLCWISAGRFDAYYEAGLKPWDTCAGFLIASEAGAHITDFYGKKYNPLESLSLCASGGPFHEEFLEAVEPLKNNLEHLKK